MYFQQSFSLYGLDFILPGALSKAPAAAGTRAPSPSLTDALESLLAIKRAQGVSARWLSVLGNTLKPFVRRMPPLWSDVTPDLVSAYLGTYPGLRHRNNHLAAIRQFLAYSRERGWVDGNPIAGLAPARVAAKDATAYTPPEVAAILAAACDRARPLLALIAFAGIRTAESLRLDWSDIDLKRRLVFVSAAKAKTRSRRLSPLSDNCAAWLTPGAGPLYPHKARGLEWDLVQALAKSGVTSRQNGLRHSFLSYRLALTENESAVALAAGTSPAMLFRNYRSIATKEDAARYFAIVPAPAMIS